jgi:predicted ribosome quality control (RQC) complex YloA/Tae2 family protein
MNFRKFVTRQGTLILIGRDAENNEELIKQTGKNEEVFHTESPGSPFVNIKGKPKGRDVKTAAILCAKYSKAWKKNKKDVVVHRFKGKDIYKSKGMKTGTFGVKKFRKIKVKKSDIKNFEKNYL